MLVGLGETGQAVLTVVGMCNGFSSVSALSGTFPCHHYGLQHSGLEEINPILTCHCDVCWGWVQCLPENSTSTDSTGDSVAIGLSHDPPQ